jgi:hypothetical protein
VANEDVVVWYNPRCSKCRGAAEILAAHGVSARRVFYLDPFNLGCEPGATAPIVTPFNGNQHAGIQVLNTAQFPVDAGPLSHVSR